MAVEAADKACSRLPSSLLHTICPLMHFLPHSNLVAAGFTEPTPIQRQAATALLAGRELLAIAPTGSGKHESAAV